jgi:hypothetical protein
MSIEAHKGSLVPPALGIVFGAAVLAATSTIRPGMLPNDPGPSFLPMIAGIGLIVTSLYLVFVREPHEGLPDRGGLFRLLATILLVGLYLSVMEPIGFPAATALFLALEMWVIGVRHPLNLTLTPIALSAAVYITFRFGLDVPLPATRVLGVLL